MLLATDGAVSDRAAIRVNIFQTEIGAGDVRRRVIPREGEVLEPEIEKVFDLTIDDEARLARRAGELGPHLFHVIEIDVSVTESVNEPARLETGDMRDHMGQQGVRGDVEGHAQEHVRAALDRKHAQGPVCSAHDLPERVAGRQGHSLTSAGFQAETIMRRESGFSAMVRIRSAIWSVSTVRNFVLLAMRAPFAPLALVYRAEISVLVGPFVPDGDPVLLKVADIGVARTRTTEARG